MKSWFLWLILGILMIAAGVFALFNPLAATLTAEQLAAWLFLFGGILQIDNFQLSQLTAGDFLF